MDLSEEFESRDIDCKLINDDEVSFEILIHLKKNKPKKIQYHQ
jgi:hypothetical protein